MKLDLRFSERPVESLWCQAIAALVPQRTFLAQGVLASLDAKLGGFLARLEKKGFWTGEYGENLLVASQGMIKADKILLAGLGPSESCSLECVVGRAAEVGSALVKLRAQDVGVHIPVMEGREQEYPEFVEDAVRAIVGPYISAHGDEADFLVKAVLTVERYFWGRITPAAERLRVELEQATDISVVVEREKREAMGY